MKNNKVLWIITLLVIVAVVAWAAMKGKHEHPGTPLKQEESKSEHPAGGAEHPAGDKEHAAEHPAGDAEKPGN